MKTKVNGCLLALSLTFGATLANATEVTLYNNLDAAGVTASGSAQGLNPIGSLSNLSISTSFNTGSFCPNGCLLGDATLRLFGVNSPLGSLFELGLYKDDNVDSTLPGATQLASFFSPANITDQLGDNIFSPDSNVMMPGQPIVLGSGTNYWLKLTTTNPDGVEWGLSSSTLPNAGQSFVDFGGLAAVEGQFGLGFQRDPTSNFMFKIQATELAVSNVPVPAAFWLMLTGISGLAIRSRKNSAILES